MIGRKQSSGQTEWEDALIRIRADHYPVQVLDRLIDQTVSEVRRVIAGKRVAFAWSGGKDSIALEYVMRQAGVTDCVMGMCDLEYPAFLRWVTANMPLGLEVINTGQDLEWLAERPEMLFPARAEIAAKWFKAIQHTAQARYYAMHRLDVIALGRRRADGNYLGAAGQNIYTDAKGVTRYSPLGGWAHIDILALVELKTGGNWPPIYSWPRGFQVGTHAWAARQWCGSIENGWREVSQIDPEIVCTAADFIPSARRFLEG
jgi:3'-phosphoadenosine 5'-phosphosulfate sulfotransferase (PAPS reductase)/FAD synthetase